MRFTLATLQGIKLFHAAVYLTICSCSCCCFCCLPRGSRKMFTRKTLATPTPYFLPAHHPPPNRAWSQGQLCCLWSPCWPNFSLCVDNSSTIFKCSTRRHFVDSQLSRSHSHTHSLSLSLSLSPSLSLAPGMANLHVSIVRAETTLKMRLDFYRFNQAVALCAPPITHPPLTLSLCLFRFSFCVHFLRHNLRRFPYVIAL